MSFKEIYGQTNFTDEEAREYISLLFDGYAKRKLEKRLYNKDGIPEIIIKIYYSCIKKPNFEEYVSSFKKRYIYNECKIENVHTIEEQEGLACVYDYIQSKDDLESISIYDLSYIHEALYSKTCYPEFGGKYRNDNGFIADSPVEIAPYYTITHEMNLLRPEVEELVKSGLKLSKMQDVDMLINYIDRCIKLNCKLIKIHPFKDGNGRSVRAFTNLLFKLANIPPVYIEEQEKEKYHEAMQNALVGNDLSDILHFYHYKICDSIMELDIYINKNIEQEVTFKEEEVSNNKRPK